MRVTIRTTLLAIVVAVGAGLAACGGDGGDESEGPASLDSLIARLPAEGDFSRRLSAADFTLAREQEGLPADFDLLAARDRGTQTGTAALRTLGVVASPTRSEVLDQAVDGTRITAAASTGVLGDGTVVVVATDRPFDEIADVIEAADEGGEVVREDDVLEMESPSAGGPAAIASGGEGIVVFAGSREAAEAAQEEREPGPAGQLLAEVEGVVRAALEPESSECVTAVAVGDDLKPQTGRIVLALRSEPDASAVQLPFKGFPGGGVALDVDYGETSLTGETVEVDVAYTPGRLALGVDLAGILLDRVVSSGYRCP